MSAARPEGGRSGIFAIAFTDRGQQLAEEICGALGGEAARSGRPDSLREWTGKHFPDAKGLIFVGAAGIAVRAIAPHVRNKTEDPAVIVVDERAENVIPILSGHLGGANALAARIAEACGGRCVITTATDLSGVFAVDQWAKRQNCAILEPERIRRISGGLLAGEQKRIRSRWPVSGEVPSGLELTEGPEADIILDIYQDPAEDGAGRPIHLVPRICTLGVGCRKGTGREALETALQDLLLQSGIREEAIAVVSTIDLKAEEAGLLAFCSAHGWPLRTYTAEQLRRAPGEFSGSAFVAEVTGVDNVCERSAVLASEGELIQRKLAGGGVTMALAMSGCRPDWEWCDE